MVSMVDRLEVAAAQQLGQLSRVNLVAFATVRQQGALPRVAHHNFGHMRLQQVIQPCGPSSFLKRDMQISAQPLDKLQNGYRLRFDDGLHDTLPAEFITAIVIASLCTSMPTNFVLSIIRCSFLLEANAQNLPQKGRTLIMRSRKGNPKEIWAKQQFASHNLTYGSSLKFTWMMVSISTGSPFSSVGSYLHWLTASTAARARSGLTWLFNTCSASGLPSLLTIA